MSTIDTGETTDASGSDAQDKTSMRLESILEKLGTTDGLKPEDRDLLVTTTREHVGEVAALCLERFERDAMEPRGMYLSGDDKLIGGPMTDDRRPSLSIDENEIWQDFPPDTVLVTQAWNYAYPDEIQTSETVPASLAKSRIADARVMPDGSGELSIGIGAGHRLNSTIEYPEYAAESGFRKSWSEATVYLFWTFPWPVSTRRLKMDFTVEVTLASTDPAITMLYPKPPHGHAVCGGVATLGFFGPLPQPSFPKVFLSDAAHAQGPPNYTLVFRKFYVTGTTILKPGATGVNAYLQVNLFAKYAPGNLETSFAGVNLYDNPGPVIVQNWHGKGPVTVARPRIRCTWL